MNIDLLFPSIISKDKLLGYNIIDEIYNLKRLDDGVKVSNVGGWHSKDVTHVFKDLIRAIEHRCNILLHEFEINGLSKVTSSWININGYKDYNQTHTHPCSFFSGVFYIKVPKNSGALKFENPNQLASNNFYGLKIQSHNLINSSSYKTELEENDLVIFNSHLPHYVEPNLSSEDRISMAFNAIVING